MTRTRWGILLTVIAVGGSSLFPGTAVADREVIYDLTSASDGVRISVYADDFLLVADLLDVGIPSAQATTHSSAGSSGFASNPYPGATVVTAPDLVAGQIQTATGQDVDPPGYPLYVRTDGTHRDAEVDQRGYVLRSRSDSTSSEAMAEVGVAAEQGSVARVTARARTDGDPNADVATAIAESDVVGLSINDVLRFGRVHSEAVVKVSPDGTLRRSSDLAIAETTVAGQRVVLTPKGLEAAGESVELPSSDQLDETLRQAGVSVRYLAPERTKHGVVSAGIEVSAVQSDPTGGSNAKFTVRYVLGRAVAAAGGSAHDYSSRLGNGPSASPPSSSGTGSSGQAAGGPAPEEAPVAKGTPADAPAPAIAEPEANQTVQARLVAWPTDLGLAGVYLVVVLAALAMFAGGTLVRLLGVRTRWE